MWERLESKCTPEPNSGCWLWTGYCNNMGYGQLNVDGVPRLVHRISWELHKGTIPQGMCVCHKCDVTQCLNPDHLFLGTYADNARDAVKKGRNGARTHPERQPRGMRSGSAKLDDSAVYAIRASRETDRVVAARYGVHPTLVSAVRCRKIWKHLPEKIAPQASLPDKQGD